MSIHPANRRIKDRFLTAPYEICIERARLYTRSYRKTGGTAPSMRAALALAETLENMTLSISEDEIIAGNRTSKTLGVVLPVERGDVNLILSRDLSALCARKTQPFFIDPKDRRELISEILPYWKGRTVRDQKKKLYRKNGLNFFFSLNPFSHLKERKALDLKRLARTVHVPGASLSYKLTGLIEVLHNNPALVMNVFDVQGHLILGHRNILKTGFSGVRQKAALRLEEARTSGDLEGADFLSAVMLSCDAVRAFSERLSLFINGKAHEEASPERKRELLEMAERCARVPYLPPENFAEAVQALWLTQVVATIAHGMAAIFAIGRFDQYLYPFYEKDIRRGLITQDHALRLLEEFLIKLGTNLMVLPYAAKKTGNELGSDSCAPTVGGVDENGDDAVNELSHLILTAFSNVKSLGNSFSIRLSEKSPATFWTHALETFRHTSGAALFSDEAVVRALAGSGMKLGDARNYGVIGCVEPAGDGDTFGCTSGNDISLAAAMEMTMKNGVLRVMGKRIGPKTGDPVRFSSYDEFFSAFKKQVMFQIDTVAKAVNLKDAVYRDSFPCPLVSATIRGCVENARDMTAGGASYNFGSIGARGFATAVDSLAAVRRFVFEDRSISMNLLCAMLDSNFEGFEMERQKLLNKGPKYGCDDDGADEIARELAGFFCTEVSKKATIRGGPFRPGFFSYGMHVLEGLYLGASPNGRRAGDPVSNSFSPSNGAEKKGPTAVLRSASKIDHSLIPNGCAINVKLLPQMFSTEERLQKMTGLVRGFFSSGGMELSLNVVSNEILRKAQENPAEYRDLAVRVSGYSALFCDLGKPLQDEIISRTEFERA